MDLDAAEHEPIKRALDASLAENRTVETRNLRNKLEVSKDF